MEEYVDILRSVAKRFELALLDLYNLSAVDTRIKGVVDKYIPDGLHPNDAVHILLADEIAQFLTDL